MTKHNISQVPVIEKNQVIGLITESNILDNTKDKTAQEIMTESPPLIDKNAKISIIVQLLKFYPIIIVKEKEKLIGVITKADIIKVM